MDDCTVYRFEDKLMIVVNAVEHRARPGSTSSSRRAAPTSGSRTSPTKWVCSRSRARGAQALLQPLTDTPLDDDRLLPLRGRQGRRRPVLHLPHRLHRRGRLRALLPRSRHRGDLGGAHRRRRAAHRPRRPRLAPAGDGLRALRQRDRRHHHAARGRPRLDREAGQGLRRSPATRRSRAQKRAASPASWWASGSTAEASPATGIRSMPQGREVDVVRSGTMSPSLGQADRHHLPPGRRRQGRHPVRGGVPGGAGPGRGGEAAVLYQGQCAKSVKRCASPSSPSRIRRQPRRSAPTPRATPSPPGRPARDTPSPSGRWYRTRPAA